MTLNTNLTLFDKKERSKTSWQRSIAAFFASPARNRWCHEVPYEIYMVKSRISGELIISNLFNRDRRNNFEKNENVPSTGKFKVLMDYIEQLALEHGFTRIKFETIINDFLPKVLTKRGYKEIYNRVPGNGYPNMMIELMKPTEANGKHNNERSLS